MRQSPSGYFWKKQKKKNTCVHSNSSHLIFQSSRSPLVRPCSEMFIHCKISLRETFHQLSALHTWHSAKGIWHFHGDAQTSAITVISRQRRQELISHLLYCSCMPYSVRRCSSILPHQCLALIRPQTKMNCIILYFEHCAVWEIYYYLFQSIKTQSDLWRDCFPYIVIAVCRRMILIWESTNPCPTPWIVCFFLFRSPCPQWWL